MSTSSLDYLRHILDETSYLIVQAARVSREQFLADETMKRAFARSIEIIGEASKAVPPSIRTQCPEVEWRSMAAMRDRLIHGYLGVDYEIVWDVATRKAPFLHEQITRFMERTDNPAQKQP